MGRHMASNTAAHDTAGASANCWDTHQLHFSFFFLGEGKTEGLKGLRFPGNFVPYR